MCIAIRNERGVEKSEERKKTGKEHAAGEEKFELRLGTKRGVDKSEERKKNGKERAAGEEKFELHLGTKEEWTSLKGEKRTEKSAPQAKKSLNCIQAGRRRL